MSPYSKRANIFCPIAMVADLNQLSGAWGLSIHDASYFGTGNHLDGEGNLYCVRSTACTDEWLTRALSGELQIPEWDIEAQQLDMVAAGRAKTLLRVHPEPADDAPYSVQISPDEITVIIDLDPQRAIAAAGLILIESEEV